MIRFISPCIRHAGRSRPTILQSTRIYIRSQSTNPTAVKPTGRSAIRPQARVSDLATQNAQYKRIKLVEALYAAGNTTLYKAPRRLTYFRLQCWALLGMGMSFMTWFMNMKLYDVAEMRKRGIEYPWLATIGETSAAVLIAAVCGTCVFRLMNHVQIVQLVKEMDVVYVRLSSRSIVPFVKSHVAVRPYNLAITDRLALPKSPPDWLAIRKLDESSRPAVVASVMRNTFKAFPLLIWHIINEARRFLTSEGSVKAKIIGEDANNTEASKGYYILDVDGAWAVLNPEEGKKEKLALYEVGHKQRF